MTLKQGYVNLSGHSAKVRRMCTIEVTTELISLFSHSFVIFLSFAMITTDTLVKTELMQISELEHWVIHIGSVSKMVYKWKDVFMSFNVCKTVLYIPVD